MLSKNIFYGFLIVSLFVKINSFAQTNYQSGYILDVNGDTISGFIDYRGWENSPRQISFKKVNNSNPSLYSPLEVTEFKVANELYIGAIVQFEASPHKVNNLNSSSSFILKTDTLFLKVMVKGSKSLFYSKNEGKYQFYIRNSNGIELLAYKRYIKELPERNILLENKKYIGQLLHYFRDNKDLHSLISKSRYTKGSLEKVFLMYDSNSLLKGDYISKTEKVDLEFGLMAGVSFSKMYFKSDYQSHNHLTKVNYPLSITPTFGLFLDVVFPRKRKKIAVKNEVLFANYSSIGKYTDINSMEMEIGFTQIKVNNLIKYKHFLEKGLQLYFVGGLGNGFIVNSTNQKTTDYSVGAETNLTNERALKEFNKFEQGVILGMGINKNMFSLENRIELGTGVTARYKSLSSPIIRNSIILGYKF